ncbi:MAG TPA: hypothetical protein ENG81_04620, partial [Candidatus Bathyarchaeota archaeon]|nr:hypothetical protein [Candidatus Bathyarchaeota archaeon]
MSKEGKDILTKEEQKAKDYLDKNYGEILPEDTSKEEADAAFEKMAKTPVQGGKETDKLTVSEFAQRVRERYPDAKDYQEASDEDLTNAMVEKYPVYRKNIDFSTVGEKAVKKKESSESFSEKTPDPLNPNMEFPSTTEEAVYSSESPLEPEEKFSLEQLKRGEDVFNSWKKRLEPEFPMALNEVPFKPTEDIVDYTAYEEEEYQTVLKDLKEAEAEISVLEGKEIDPRSKVKFGALVPTSELTDEELKTMKEYRNTKYKVSELKNKKEKIELKRKDAEFASVASTKFPSMYREVVEKYGAA